MIKRTQAKLNELRQQPEEVKQKEVNKWTIIMGAVIIIIALAVLLPLQLIIN